jgi:hypothetical protein
MRAGEVMVFHDRRVLYGQTAFDPDGSALE